LVTGVTGDVGKEVLTQLIKEGLPAKAAARDLSKAESSEMGGAEIVLFDYDLPETFGPALAGVERLFIVPPPLNPQWHELVKPLIDAAADCGVRHIVNLSQMCAQEVENLPLGMAEKTIEASGIAYTHLRPNWFMQTYNGSVLDGAKGPDGIHVPAGDGKASFIDMRDIAAVAVAALTGEEHLNKAYTLTGGQAIDHSEVARVLSTATDRNIAYFSILEEEMRTNLKFANLADAAIELVIVLYQLLRQGRLEYVSSDVANILGREPITLQQYARDYAGSWK
jgi:uncharacterized protein YbjT (DUF2867 family)